MDPIISSRITDYMWSCETIEPIKYFWQWEMEQFPEYSSIRCVDILSFFGISRTLKSICVVNRLYQLKPLAVFLTFLGGCELLKTTECFLGITRLLVERRYLTTTNIIYNKICLTIIQYMLITSSFTKFTTSS